MSESKGVTGQDEPKGDAAATRSPLVWALLGLVIERPSHGYELAKRFNRVYDDSLVLSNRKHIYRLLDALSSHGLIEEMDPSAKEKPARNRLPKPQYRVTAEGRRAYEDWLVTQMAREREQQSMFARQFGMLPPEAALEVLDHYEEECLRQERAGKEAGGEAVVSAEDVAGRLDREDERLAMEVRVSWLDYARRELNAAIEERAKKAARESTQ